MGLRTLLKHSISPFPHTSVTYQYMSCSPPTLSPPLTSFFSSFSSPSSILFCRVQREGLENFRAQRKGRVSWPSQYPLKWAGGKTGPHGFLWITPSLKWHDGWMFLAVDSDSKPSFCETFQIYFEKVSFPL